VPSLTETLALARPEAVVGATDWCTEPAQLSVTRVRGTKNPDLRAIIGLQPDLVVANMEENRELDIRRLEASGVAVWVTRIQTLEQALTSIERLFEEGLGWEPPPWLAQARALWADPANLGSPRVAVAIWRDPWMVVGRDTFTGDLLTRLGCVHEFAAADERYPRVQVADLDSRGLDLVLLPDEPYVFGPEDGPEAFGSTRTALVSGRLLTWYGPSLVPARTILEERIRSR
jgi:ABC-type Fe3+-hydroxamate transport system substrate-binding protein